MRAPTVISSNACDMTVIDGYSRESLATNVAGSIRSGAIVELVAKLVGQHGTLKQLPSERRARFVSESGADMVAQIEYQYRTRRS